MAAFEVDYSHSVKEFNSMRIDDANDADHAEYLALQELEKDLDLVDVRIEGIMELNA